MKKNSSGLLQKVAALIILGIILLIALATQSATFIFFWCALAFMVINFWANERKPETLFFFLPWIISGILMVIFTIRLFVSVGNYVLDSLRNGSSDSFGSFWHTNSGWPSLLLSFILVLYGAFLLDNEVRLGFINRINSLFSFRGKEVESAT